MLEQIFSVTKIINIILSEISKIEFTSAVWKKVRMREITEFEAKVMNPLPAVIL